MIGALYFLVLGLYLLLLLLLSHQWKKIPFPPPVENHPSGLNATLLLPFRNEKSHLTSLLPHLLHTLPDHLKLIFIDDHSEDGGAGVIHSFIEKNQLGHWLCIKSKGIGKKAALTRGVEASSSTLLLTTDADVRLQTGWFESMSAPFSHPNVQLVAGPVISSGGAGLFARFQQIEWAAIILLTAISFHRKRPLMCSGANLAFRRDAFLKVRGYQGNAHLLSGDDEFLMKKIIREYGAASGVYRPYLSALVTTFPLSGPAAWIRQRSRWASKWNAHKGQTHIMTAAGLALAALAQVLTFFLFLISWKWSIGMAVFWIGKFAVERAVLSRVLSRFQRSAGHTDYLIAGWLFPVLVLAALPSAISGKYSWKGRKN
ncbi:Glycosyltransferase, catalytic subunit of cellulose synthase and poly-beta-1,6-N-acetylglucosamine synthase [Cyclobacterium lianum]|uniref:Glycosyltransferase, catalytic subunit of cellulose synthase and poly-beta-1,6-N-acetylglucosamine synthase n=1 Tax=Cyclobacterium lianum TaxID=388280 RepID=A0A1M7P8J1_9BACT|nr:glycosyltransferase [Cyclobacterium lianum]SHN13076.1 Glycosyltransferase, catalytic subunit of cellulose synthase and poly-beta-1,6-N-acetylglucosamine synthase [Cyclobacterium lianum]